MKSKYALFVVAALLSTSFVDAHKANNAPKTFVAKAAMQKKGNVTTADAFKKILRKSARAPWDMLSGFLLFKVGGDIYTKWLQQYGSYITDADIVKRIERSVPRGYGEGLAPWAMHAMVGYCAVATVREMLLKSTPEVAGLRKALDKLTEAAKQD